MRRGAHCERGRGVGPAAQRRDVRGERPARAVLHGEVQAHGGPSAPPRCARRPARSAARAGGAPRRGREVREGDAGHVHEHGHRVAQAGGPVARQVGLRDVARDHAFEPKPMRVRNIFICSIVVFCASSRMMKASFSVRPRMKASGATSITLRSISLRHAVEADHLVERVVHRPQVRVDLLRQVAGQEAEPLARLDRRPHQHDAAHRVALQRLDGAGDREIGLAGAGRADAEGQVMVADVAQVLRLVRAAAAHRPRCVCTDEDASSGAAGLASMPVPAARGARPRLTGPSPRARTAARARAPASRRSPVIT
jgi:hypothetical protein